MTRRNWVSHLWMAAVVLLFGLVVAFSFGAVLGAGGSPAESFTSGFSVAFFLVAMLVLVPHNTAWTPRRQTRRDFFSDGHTAFLLSLPIGVREMVLGRSLTFIVSVLVFSFLFFTPSYILSEPLRAQLGVIQYLLFAGLWAGVALAFAGVSLFTELGLGGKAGFASHMTVLFLLFFLVVFLGGVLEINYLLEAVELVQDRGPLPTALALLAGVAVLAVSSAFTTSRLHRREISA